MKVKVKKFDREKKKQDQEKVENRPHWKQYRHHTVVVTHTRRRKICVESVLNENIRRRIYRKTTGRQRVHIPR